MPTLEYEKRAPDAPPVPTPFKGPAISEDWLAVILAFLLILLSAIGLLGPDGIKIAF